MDFKLRSFLISVYNFPDRRTAESIVQEINDTFSEWNLSVNRIVAATTVNETNITVGISHPVSAMLCSLQWIKH